MPWLQNLDVRVAGTSAQHGSAHPELLAAKLHLCVLLLAAGVAVCIGGVLAEVQLLGLQVGAALMRLVPQH